MQGFIARTIPLVLRRAITMAPALIVLAIGAEPDAARWCSARSCCPSASRSRSCRSCCSRAGATSWARWSTGAARRSSRRVVAALIIALNVFLLYETFAGLACRAMADGPRRHASRRSSTRCPTTGPTSSSTCGSSTRRATSTRRSTWSTCNAQPYSKHDWHWRILVAHRFGHAAAAPAVHSALSLLDEAGIDGELAVREVRTGRVGRPDVGPAGVGAPGVPRIRASSRGPRRRARARPAVRVEGPGGARAGRPRGRPADLRARGLGRGRRHRRPRRRPHDRRARRRRARRVAEGRRRAARRPHAGLLRPRGARGPRARAGGRLRPGRARARAWRARAPRSSAASPTAPGRRAAEQPEGERAVDVGRLVDEAEARSQSAQRRSAARSSSRAAARPPRRPG